MAINISKFECANTPNKKKKSLFVTWTDEDPSNNSNFDKDYRNNYVAFTTSFIKGLEVDTNGEPNRGYKEDFLNTYKTMIGK